MIGVRSVLRDRGSTARRWIGLFLLLGLLTPTGAAAKADLGVSKAQRILERWLKSPKLKGVTVGVSMKALDGDTPRASHLEGQVLNPASGAKLLTTAAALLAMGQGKSFTTTVLGRQDASGTVEDGLMLVGGGDPKLLADHLTTMAKELRARGVRRIEGGIRLVTTVFDKEDLPPAYGQKNATSGYRASIGAAASEFGAITLSVRPGRKRARKPRIKLASAKGYADLENRAGMAKGKKDELLYELQALENGRMKVIIRGTLGWRHPRFSQRIRMLNPNLATGFLLKSELQNAGITVVGQIRETVLPSPRPPLLVEHTSAKLKELLRDVNIFSNNFMAEMIFKHLGAVPGGATWARAQAACSRHLETLGIEAAEVRIVNGSGLYRGTHVSARAMVQLLISMRQNATFGDDFLQMLAVSGRAGTLKKRMRGWLKGRISAKTGTLDEVVSLSGFVQTRRRGVLAFAIFVNEATPERTTILRGHIDRLIARWARM